MTTPAQQLEGITLSGGWIVEKRIEKAINATGGVFSEGYIVKSKQGSTAFLKALDYSKALGSEDPARTLQAVTTAYNFERSLLAKCKAKRSDRVVTILDDGSVTLNKADPYTVVQYIIFELADGDVRAHLNTATAFDVAWLMRALHHIATGLNQLHSQGIAHQDVKPSNILVFNKEVSKVSDLGRASLRGEASPFDEREVAGDKSYSPPELLYGFIPSDWQQRRFGCDAYMMGSMIVFLFNQVSMTSLVKLELSEEHNWLNWQGSFEDVLPYLRDGYGRALIKVKASLPKDFASELAQMITELCEPEVHQRGHPITRSRLGNPYSLERYVSKLDLLARRAEINMTRSIG